MYQSPKLEVLGKAHELVLGIAVIGYDLDGQAMGEKFEYAEDVWPADGTVDGVAV